MNKMSVKHRNIIRLILIGLILIGAATSYHYYSYSLWDNCGVVEASASTMKSNVHVLVKSDNTQQITTPASEAPINTATDATQPMVRVATAKLPQTSDNSWQTWVLTVSGMIGIVVSLVMLNLRRIKVES
ncbi:MAG: hypothetical protein LIR22_03290 [Bacillota bacterium]|nr:hypothetical protein [Bacillota bacterium]